MMSGDNGTINEMLIMHSCDYSIKESTTRLLDMNESWDALMLRVAPVVQAAATAEYVN
jgi:hypothetical protein